MWSESLLNIDNEALLRCGRIFVDASVVIWASKPEEAQRPDTVGCRQLVQHLLAEGRLNVAAVTLVEVGSAPATVRAITAHAFDTRAARVLLDHVPDVHRRQRLDAMGLATAKRWGALTVASTDDDWHELAPRFGLRCVRPMDLLVRDLFNT